MPFTPLEFTRERVADALGPRSAYLDGRMALTNQNFYDTTYVNLPLAYQRRFWGTRNLVTKRVSGLSVGISGGRVLIQAAEAIAEQLAKTVLRRIIGQLLKRVNADALQSSTSINATLYGMDGRDTYNLSMNDFTNNTNLFFINAGIGAVTQASLNIVLFGNFPTMPHRITRLPGYIMDVYNQSVAWTIIGDAAVGVIPPGGSISLISS